MGESISDALRLKLTFELKAKPDFVWFTSTGASLIAFTMMENGPILDEAISSVAMIVILLAMPLCSSPGVPVNAPVVVLKLSHAGLFIMLNTALPTGLESMIGMKLYTGLLK